MMRLSLLLFSLCIASMIMAEDIAKNEEIAMLKIVTDESLIDTSCQDPLSNLESQMQEVFVNSALGAFGAKAASAQPQIHSNRLFVKADALIWKAFFGGSDFAVTNTSSDSNILTGDTKRADFRWRYGFRTEVGYHLPHDSWDAVLNYTWFHDKSDRNTTRPANGSIATLFYESNLFTTNATASICWHLQFQNFDVDLRRPYFLSRHFSLEPFFGLRNSWINQGYSARYSQSTGNITRISVLTKQDFWGIGPTAGMTTDWHMSRNVWFFGSFGGSILASDYDISSKVINNIATQMDIAANTKRLSPNVQGSLGFGWQMNFNRNRNHIAMRFCYEAQYWWKQNLTIDYTNTSSFYRIARMGEDLGLHGFTLDMLFDF